MAAMAGECPEMVMFHLFGPVYALERARAEEPSVVLPADNNSLWIPFFIGMLEAMPPTMRMIEGNEHGYKVHSETEALRRVNEVRNANGPLARLFPEDLRGIESHVDLDLGVQAPPRAVCGLRSASSVAARTELFELRCR